MKIKNFLICTIMALSILCCFSSFATDNNNDTCVTNFLSLKPADNYSFLIAKNDAVPLCSRCGGKDHIIGDCPLNNDDDDDDDDEDYSQSTDYSSDDSDY
jgi:hypothetical protein